MIVIWGEIEERHGVGDVIRTSNIECSPKK